MQVILLEKIVNLGDLGDVVNVKNGYARNYLIPQQKARRATEAAIKEFEARRAELEKAQAERLAAAQKVGESLKDFVLTVKQKAGVDGRLFGSVTNMDIAEGLVAAGFETIEKHQVCLDDGAFKSVGEYPVRLHLHADVDVEIQLVVEAEML